MRDYGLSPGQQNELWRQWKQGEPIRAIARSVGAEQHHVRRFLAQSGGVWVQDQRRAVGHLTLHEREEISRGIAAGMSGRAIARRLNRSASTVAREISRNGGRESYPASDAEARASSVARRPKPAKLTIHPALRQIVEERLECRWSPQQIACWLPLAYPLSPACGSHTRRSTYRCSIRAGGH